MPPADSQAFLRELGKELWTAADKLPAGTEIRPERGSLTRSSKTTSTGKLIDDALEAVEKESPKLKNVPVASVYDRRAFKSRIPRHQPDDPRPNRRRTNPRKTSNGRRPTLPLQIDPANLAGLIDLIDTIPFWSGAAPASHEPATVADRRYNAKYILGHILKKGAQASRLFHPKQTAKMAGPRSYFTPKSIGDIIVFGQDQWAWGAHLRRAQRVRRVRLRRKQPNQSNPTTWRLYDGR